MPKPAKGRVQPVFLLIAFFLLIALGSGGVLLWHSIQLRHEADDLSALASQVAQRVEAPSASAPPNAEPQILPEYAGLAAQNPDFAGWVRIADTKLDYPVMASPEEPERYLKRDFAQNASASGVPFVGEDSALSPRTDNVILYGHNMKGGAMFAALLDYQTEAFFTAHPQVQFDTLTSRETYDVLAVFPARVLAQDEAGFRYYDFTAAADEAAFDTFVRQVKTLSLYDTGVSAQYGDALLTLSTCGKATDARFVVVARRAAASIQ